MEINRTSYTNSLSFYGATTPSELLAVYGSPLYVYNEDILRARAKEMAGLINHPRFTASYSTKANSNPHLLRIIREAGLHADAMSPGEMALLHKAGYTRQNIHYVCNNVTAEELSFADEMSSIVSVDSLAQLEQFCRHTQSKEVMVRVNPGVGAGHHKKVITAGLNTKFGVSPEEFPQMHAILATYGVTLTGINQHIGSLFLEPDAYLAASKRLLEIAETLPDLTRIDFGGGFGIPYHKYEQQKRLDLTDLGNRLTEMITAWEQKTGYSGSYMTEPGRYVVGECGVLLGTVTATKNNGPTRYVGTDVGFSVLLRPVLYEAFHDIEVYPCNTSPRQTMQQTIVGNICETGDVIAPDRVLPELQQMDTIGILDAGAYGSVMASNYTQRLRPAEVLITSKGTARLIRHRDTVEDLTACYPM